MYKIFTFFRAIILIGCLSTFAVACSTEDEPNSLNTISVEIASNTNEPIIVYGIGNKPDSRIEINNYYYHTFDTKANEITIRAKCYDFCTLITIKVWVNGNLVQEVSGYKWVYTDQIKLLE